MRQAFKPFSAIASVVGFALTAAVSQAATVTVFAAASLTDALTEIAAAYEHRTGDRIVFNFAASGTLARQIELGAPADIFFAADEAKADALDAKGLLASGTRSSPLGNTLVIVTTPDTVGIDSPAGLTNAAIQRILETRVWSLREPMPRRIWRN